MHSRCILIIHNNKCVSRECLVKWPGNLIDIGQSRHSSLSRGDNSIRYRLRNQFPWNPSCACSLRYVTFQDVVCTLFAQVCVSRRVFRPIVMERLMPEIRLSVGRQLAKRPIIIWYSRFPSFLSWGGRNCGSCSAVVEAHHRRASTAVV